MEIFLVGGAVRDEIMGVPCKDFDYTVVLEKSEVGTDDPFQVMATRLTEQGFKFFQEKPEFLTLRAMFPKGHVNAGQVADFVLARKEGVYTDGRRPDKVTVGRLMDDLSRRDLTMNAIAKAEDGQIIDPFGGQTDIKNGIIRCVGSAEDRLREDALRGLRAMRFCITKSFSIDEEIRWVLTRTWFADALASVSKERQREEMEKMFAHSTLRSLILLEQFTLVASVVFTDGLRLSATMKA